MNIIKAMFLDEGKIKPVDNKLHHGAWSFVARNEPLEQELYRIFGRWGLCLKVFKKPARPLDEFTWGDAILLTECTKVQNLFAWHGHAPRVYAVVLLNGERWAQVTDYVSPNGKTPDRVGISKMMAKYRIRTNWDPSPKNFVGSQLVDFQPFHFSDANWYEQSMKLRAFRFCAWGSRSEPYQAIEEWEVAGQRDMAARCEAMKWASHNWRGQTVLDLGCNSGSFCRQADRDGALRAVGVDLPNVAEVAYEVANWHGHWNLDYLSVDLPRRYLDIGKETGIEQFDVVLALSVDRQIGYGPWMGALCKDGGMFYLEGHVPDHEEDFREDLERDWQGVEFLGMTRDHGPRPLFRCWK